MYKVNIGGVNCKQDSAVSHTFSWQVRAQYELEYNVTFLQEAFALNQASIANIYAPFERVLIFIDRNVLLLHGARIKKYFISHNIKPTFKVVDASEENKQHESLLSVIGGLHNFKPVRAVEPILAIGGGVLTDLVGYAASIYKRGSPFIRVPTTLMGMIDAAIGVKNAINHLGHKNLLGSYYPSEQTFIDVDFLQTLPKLHLRNGIAEIIKMGIIGSSSLFKKCQDHIVDLAARNISCEVMAIMRQSISCMLSELADNLFETNLQRAVDFGHTWSPLLELSNQPLLHGLAVNIDMAFSTAIAYELELLDRTSLQAIISLMQSVQLPIGHQAMLDMNFIQQGIRKATIHRGGKLNLPLPHPLGSCCFIDNLSPKKLKATQKLYKELSKQGVHCET